MTSAIFGTMAATVAMVVGLVLLQALSSNAPARVYLPQAVAIDTTNP